MNFVSARGRAPRRWEDSSGRQAAAAPTLRSPSPRLPGLFCLAALPPARASVGQSFLPASPPPRGRSHQAAPRRPTAARTFLCVGCALAPRADEGRTEGCARPGRPAAPPARAPAPPPPAMPFHQRTVEPARLRRPETAGAAGAPLFRSLEQVSSHALVCLLAQLADLSRCAGDIFGELEGQAAALGHRTAALHRRLDALHAAAARLDHRRVKIREWPAGRGRGTRRGGAGPAAPSRPLAVSGGL